MQVYAGLDVSLKTTHICLMDEAGKIVWRGVSASDPASIRAALSPFVGQLVRCVLETGSTSPWLASGCWLWVFARCASMCAMPSHCWRR